MTLIYPFRMIKFIIFSLCTNFDMNIRLSKTLISTIIITSKTHLNKISKYQIYYISIIYTTENKQKIEISVGSHQNLVET